MGRRNWQLIRDLERAKLAGRSDEIQRLTDAVSDSQKECEHPNQDRQVAQAAKDVETRNRGLIRKGDTIVWCLGCSYIIRHTPVGQ